MMGFRGFGGVNPGLQNIEVLLILPSVCISGDMLFRHGTPYRSALRDGIYIWTCRCIHSNMASVVFMCMYLHVLRSLYYSVSTVVSAVLFTAGRCLLMTVGI